MEVRKVKVQALNLNVTTWELQLENLNLKVSSGNALNGIQVAWKRTKSEKGNLLFQPPLTQDAAIKFITFDSGHFYWKIQWTVFSEQFEVKQPFSRTDKLDLWISQGRKRQNSWKIFSESLTMMMKWQVCSLKLSSSMSLKLWWKWFEKRLFDWSSNSHNL